MIFEVEMIFHRDLMEVGRIFKFGRISIEISWSRVIFEVGRIFHRDLREVGWFFRVGGITIVT